MTSYFWPLANQFVFASKSSRSRQRGPKTQVWCIRRISLFGVVHITLPCRKEGSVHLPRTPEFVTMSIISCLVREFVFFGIGFSGFGVGIAVFRHYAERTIEVFRPFAFGDVAVIIGREIPHRVAILRKRIR